MKSDKDSKEKDKRLQLHFFFEKNKKKKKNGDSHFLLKYSVFQTFLYFFQLKGFLFAFFVFNHSIISNSKEGMKRKNNKYLVDFFFFQMV